MAPRTAWWRPSDYYDYDYYYYYYYYYHYTFFYYILTRCGATEWKRRQGER